MKLLRATLLLIPTVLLTAPSLVRAQGDARDPSPSSDARLVADVSSVAPGDAFDVALRLDLDPGWHAYWINPGDAGLPVTMDGSDLASGVHLVRVSGDGARAAGITTACRTLVPEIPRSVV